MYGISTSAKQNFLLILEKFDKNNNVFIREYGYIKISIREIKSIVNNVIKKNYEEIYSVYNEIAIKLLNKYKFEDKAMKIIKLECLEKEHKLCLENLWEENNIDQLVDLGEYKKLAHKEVESLGFDWIWIKDKDNFESDIYYYKNPMDFCFSEFNLNKEVHKKFWEKKEKLIKSNANVKGYFSLSGQDGSTGVSKARRFYSNLTVRDLKIKLKHFFEELSENNLSLCDFIEEFKFEDAPENVVYRLNEEIVSPVYFNKLKDYFNRWEIYNIEYKNIKSQNIIDCEEFLEDLVIKNC